MATEGHVKISYPSLSSCRRAVGGKPAAAAPRASRGLQPAGAPRAARWAAAATAGGSAGNARGVYCTPLGVSLRSKVT